MWIKFQDEQMLLLAEAGVLWKKENALFLSDLHIGKVGHFRKNGLAVPKQASLETIQKLANLLEKYQPKELFFLGDLVHSRYNLEWEQFIEFRRSFSRIQFHLIKGNHDILENSEWKRAEIEVHDQTLDMGPFLLCHDLEETNSEKATISGHIHPAVKIRGVGKQSLRLPCFWISGKDMVLPAFGGFTGMKSISPGKEDEVYIIAENRIVAK